MAFDRLDEIDVIDAESDKSLFDVSRGDLDSIVPLSFQPVIGENSEPSLRIDLEGRCSLKLSLPPQQLEGLRDAIRRLEAYTRVLGRIEP
jgi:hypothetical protein